MAYSQKYLVLKLKANLTVDGFDHPASLAIMPILTFREMGVPNYPFSAITLRALEIFLVPFMLFFIIIILKFYMTH